MTQEQKDLLLKDLCARLPYGVKASTKVGSNIIVSFIGVDTIIGEHGDSYDISFITPYLFPLSSMTEDQKKECFNGTPLEIDKYGDVAVKDDFFGNSQYTDLEIYLDVINRLLKNQFDIRGLIPMGLANDATGLNIY